MFSRITLQDQVLRIFLQNTSGRTLRDTWLWEMNILSTDGADSADEFVFWPEVRLWIVKHP